MSGTVPVDHVEYCDACARVGLNTPARFDAPSPWGAWHFVCGAHLYRLPPELQKAARALEVVR